MGQQKHLSERRQGELAELYRSRQSKQDEIYSEAVQNARNTITLVAILIATVTFAVGISPPGRASPLIYHTFPPKSFETLQGEGKKSPGL